MGSRRHGHDVVHGVVGGRAADVCGYRRVFLIGSVTFGAASLWCAMASSGTMLIVARGVQGLGAAIVFPLSLALVMVVFPRRNARWRSVCSVWRARLVWLSVRSPVDCSSSP
ncbi:MAG: MFS transporter [Ilumatobacteraceae bacterium]|nr:MFS transporter [Ilumatobacteraceae bacterium]